MSIAPASRFHGEVKYGKGGGAPSGRVKGTRKGASACSVTIHGEIVVAKFFAKNGPKGWYSHACRSRADQSLSRHRPKICDSASAIGIGRPRELPVPMKMPSSSS